MGFVIEKKESFGRVCSVSTEGSWCGRGGGGNSRGSGEEREGRDVDIALTTVPSIETRMFRVQLIDDVAGVSLCGALKSESLDPGPISLCDCVWLNSEAEPNLPFSLLPHPPSPFRS